MIGRLHQALESAPWLLLDGAMGTALEELGSDLANPLWGSVALTTREGYDLNTSLHRAYVEAGAELIVANTHNASKRQCDRFAAVVGRIEPLEDGEDPKDVLEVVNRRAVESARTAAADEALVAACMMSPDRPYAAKPSLTPAKVARELKHQAALLDGYGLDLLVFEMISTEPDLKGIEKIGPQLQTPFAVGLTCDAAGRTHGGVDPVEAGRRMVDAGASVLFVQCTHYAHVEQVLRSLLAWSPIPVGAYANAGRVYEGDEWHGEPIGPGGYAAVARSWLSVGARILGGCCGTSPDHVRALAELKGAGAIVHTEPSRAKV